MEIPELYKIYKKHPIICTDTRKINSGGIFFAIKGKNFDGNKFAIDALNNGCIIAIVDEKKNTTNKKIVLVKDVLGTLQALAIYHRKKLSIPIIGITGTNGKTTSKELINCVLGSEKCCYATKGNLNNHIGVPLSVLEINKKHKIAIIEMGANHQNDIELLCNIAQPNYGVITNIGSAHLEGFKNLQGVIKTKNELYNYIRKNNGTIFVNNEDKLLQKLSQDINKFTYGIDGFCKGKITKNTPFINIKFNHYEIKSKLIGEYQFSNIMLAVCIGIQFNVKESNIKNAIESYKPENNRSEIIRTKNNKLILDAYNANPSSMKAMIISFSKLNYKNKLCILGDMLELGRYSTDEHKSVINLCKKLNLESITIGREFIKANENAFKSRCEFELFLKSNPIKNKTILLKGSRGISLEKLTKYL